MDEDSPTKIRHVFDSRWVLAFAVLTVLAAIAWALLERNPLRQGELRHPVGPPARIELLGVPPGAEVTLDGVEIDNTLFTVTPNVRHALAVRDDSGQAWRQVFVASGSLSLIVELRHDFVEVPVAPRD